MNDVELRNIVDAVLEHTRQHAGEIFSSLIFEDYHGFQKSRFPDETLNGMLKPFGYTTDDVQVEFINVTMDLKNETHFHEGSTAFTHVLGEQESFPNPKNAIVYKNGDWIPTKQGDEAMIPPKTVHGFSILPEGGLYFLSVQSPPIVHRTTDDYHRILA